MPQEIITITPGPEFKACAAALLASDGRIHPKHTEGIRENEGPFLAEVRSRVRSLPTPANAGHTGLRSDVAAGTRAHGIGDGSAYESSLGGSRAVIPAGLDSLGPGGGWFHPTWGRPPMQFQKGYSWFTKPLQAKSGEVASDLHEVNEEEADFIASHGG
ncbi:hypothetical protein [Streptomyces sp. NPDC002855]|uniref:hypothetical protein n=1 Tax=Streptomyces sp. NPDC002855 TaxID=3154437 RepID=UPI00332230CE